MNNGYNGQNNSSMNNNFNQGYNNNSNYFNNTNMYGGNQNNQMSQQNAYGYNQSQTMNNQSMYNNTNNQYNYNQNNQMPQQNAYGYNQNQTMNNQSMYNNTNNQYNYNQNSQMPQQTVNEYNHNLFNNQQNNNIMQPNNTVNKKKGLNYKVASEQNLVKGIIGALIGAILGGTCLIIINTAGYVAAIAGLVIAALTIMGYEMLGGKMTKQGLIVCVVIMLATVILAQNVYYTISIVSKYNKLYSVKISFFDVFGDVTNILSEEGKNQYFTNLALNYVFCLIGAVGLLKDKIKEMKAN